MEIISYVLDHKLYHARLVNSPKFGSVIIGGNALNEAVTNHYGPDERQIDEEIFYYVSDESILSAEDEDLIEQIEREIQ